MTIKELKQELEKYPDDLPVCVIGEGDIISIDECEVERKELILLGEYEV